MIYAVERCSPKLRAAGRAMDRAGLHAILACCAGMQVSSFGKWGPCGRVDLGCRTLFESPHTAGLHSLRSGCADVQVSSFRKWRPYGWVDLGGRTLFESPYTAGWTSVAGLSLRVPIRRDCIRSARAVLLSGNPPPDFWGDYCRDTRHFVVRSNQGSHPAPLERHRPSPR